jgi:putative redox protein
MGMARITVKHRRGPSFEVLVRGHALMSYEPVSLGADEEGPTPTELMVAGLAACAAEEAVMRLGSSGEDWESTDVGADFEWDLDTGRVASIRLTVSLPVEISEITRYRVLRAMRRCPALKLLTEPPAVEYELTAGAVRLGNRN